MSAVEEVTRLLKEWNAQFSNGSDVTGTLTSLAELFERETELYLKQDPDPFDDRHPSRSQPDCTLGYMLKQVFKNGKLIDEMVKVYCQRENSELNTVVCRLLLDILPGLESVVFQEEGFVTRLMHWAQNAPNPLQSYATGLLAPAMEVQEIAANFREKNQIFVPLMLKRLYNLSVTYLQTNAYQTNTQQSGSQESDTTDRPFAHLNNESEDPSLVPTSSRKMKHKNDSRKVEVRYSPISRKSPKSVHGVYEQKTSPGRNSLVGSSTYVNESSNSNWSELEHYVIGSNQVYPLTPAAQQRYILQYLTPMAEYQDLIGNFLEANALSLILKYIDLKQNPDARLAFEALKYLASLLCHKKIAVEFINVGGLQLLLKVPRPSIAATGVSICLYYLSYIEEAMERIFTLPPPIISDLVRYALWLLECSHDSGRCHATMFFGFTFSFRVMLRHFNEQDGLRKLFNVMSTLDLMAFVPFNIGPISEDQIFGHRQTAKTVCGAIKQYFEAHLSSLTEELFILHSKKQDDAPRLDFPVFKTLCYNVDKTEENIESLLEFPIVPMRSWKPVDEFYHFEGISVLLTLVASFCNSTYSGRAELVKNALDVLCVCSLNARTQSFLLEKIQVAAINRDRIAGMRILLHAAMGVKLKEPDIQLSALRIIINCVCAKPLSLDSSKSSTLAKKKQHHEAADLLNKMLNSVRTNNGIMVLIRLLSTKSPKSAADSFRALACKALCGLARDETVKQIISKLPLFTNGQLLAFMREPIMQDKVQEHVKFCKYGFELIEKVTGAPVAAGSESSMLSINKAEVVAKTKVVYHDSQLLHLILDHLASKGFHESVACLENEMSKISLTANSSPPLHRNLFKTPRPVLRSAPSISRCNVFNNSPASLNHNSSTIPPPSVPLQIVISRKKLLSQTKSPSNRLQKPQACSGGYVQSPVMRRPASSTSAYRNLPSISLDSIVTEYLRKQHAQCKNPVLSCPPFDLFTPHKCPEPQHKRNAPLNSTLRFLRSEVSLLDGGGCGGSVLNRKLIYSRYRTVRTFRDVDGGNDFTCCEFLNYRAATRYPRILVGKSSGELKLFNLNSGEEEAQRMCHNSDITHIQSSVNSNVIITSDATRTGHSYLWKLADSFEMIHHFGGVRYLEFGKCGEERMVGTLSDSATIIDTATYTTLQTFSCEDIGNNYHLRNRATSDYADELILSDGLIFDIRSGTMIHKLDKFNAVRNGVFHPNGREIISNTEVWDLRTFKLLRTVTTLDQCEITINPSKKVIYGVYNDSNAKVSDEKVKSYCIVDACDYSDIATINVRRPVCHLAADQTDSYIATIEQTNLYNDPDETPLIMGDNCVCRVYQIGRVKVDGEEDGEESEDSEQETDDDDENLDDDDDDDDDDNVSNEATDEDGANDISLDTDGADEDDDAIESWGSSDSEDALFSLNESLSDLI